MSNGTQSVRLGKIVKEFMLEKLVYAPEFDNILVTSTDINRPGLQLDGFFEYFGNERVQVIGKVEMTFLEKMSSQQRYKSLYELFSRGIPCVIIARGMEPFPEMVEVARKCRIPLLRTPEVTSRFVGNLIAFLNVELAPMETMHGELVEVYGEGILILGESGVGKSETALELVKRGHRLVADDLVEIRRVSSKTLVGTAPEVIRHFVEIRGIGILDVKYLYGVGSVKMTESINLVVKMELWNPQKHYERLGVDEQYTEILGIKVPSLTIPVRPGRNLAIIIEVAAMNHRQRKMGYNAAETFTRRITEDINKNRE
ncbi:MAG TPA: HPr(Ser) kinase/phosphatase [Thermoclostridium caenicola]|uniref:HPr kinase/phosphorylase n=1 Tax=Thermoclostridium caenicola TaxID=659425 RepID=A0A1M6GX88_9FIRM|nr:HPr(Ser) kinase/phosphatase [Thermoclostridium caenicola]SHJ14532.1 Hpr(Ser) kinase/phosphatase [Thermoclostridium caenicola]HOK42507.1 HPr(Ser) kinase/phosphatase [Thermoclostridium caenicola]HOL84516.1 HPr(Ser) kinase/phosphatase [Thermoclostridium caenicola]HOP72632.1 HPr(Ser) kinase/phosphatase [Thermoclostridium caenicola]HPO76414.1 HPr(Ser) kinase/phosphatase [Thermoclostridium caenicola]